MTFENNILVLTYIFVVFEGEQIFDPLFLLFWV